MHTQPGPVKGKAAGQIAQELQSSSSASQVSRLEHKKEPGEHPSGRIKYSQMAKKEKKKSRRLKTDHRQKKKNSHSQELAGPEQGQTLHSRWVERTQLCYKNLQQDSFLHFNA